MTNSSRPSAAADTQVTLRALIVDDSPIMRRMIARALELSGLRVDPIHEAASGEQALQLASDSWVDIVLCDVHMPGMDGVELVRRMSEDPLLSDVPVVMISSDRGSARAAELEALGIRGYLHKPFQPEALGRIVRQVLGLEVAS